MRRAGRILFNGMTVLSLALAMSLTVVCVVSYWREPFFFRVARVGGWVDLTDVRVQRGTFTFSSSSSRGYDGPPEPWRHSEWGARARTSLTDPAGGWGLAVLFPTRSTFDKDVWVDPESGRTGWRLTIVGPFWPVGLVGAVWPVVLAAMYVLRTYARRTPGRCPACGYDLRATPGRCPECGREAALAVAT